MTPTPAGKKDKDGNPYLYYSCIANHPDGKDSKCKVRIIPARPMELALKRVLRNLGQNKKLLKDVMDEANKESKISIHPLEKDKAKVEESIGKLTNQVKRIVEIFKQQDLVSTEIKDEYKRLLEERDRKQIALEKLQIDIDRLSTKVIDFEVIQKALMHFDEVIECMSLQDQKEIFQLLIKEVSLPLRPGQRKQA